MPMEVRKIMMTSIQDVLIILLYILGGVLIGVLIALTVKAMETLNKANRTLNDLNHKLEKTNGLFNALDHSANILKIMNNSFLNVATNFLGDFINKKKEEKEEEE